MLNIKVPSIYIIKMYTSLYIPNPFSVNPEMMLRVKAHLPTNNMLWELDSDRESVKIFLCTYKVQSYIVCAST